ncbi:MAG: glucosyl-3-phosphoglycerate synthase [Candidatus Anoxymicrobium japonicum]|uniref:Glucosyl-3-phosphoglycerate synthase n=1 Tax=Candidatus Anoxymicrobium japonicum TaxID=2013648 RepID=A0A2N3G4U5_9ACTN|nr:MAG: glucosyl-3-phosphoglycerate synthase [Candidatus Anoxymicrobium japonicum]
MEQWFKERTYDHNDFADIDRLVELKEEQGLKISVCLPTLNVASTVGNCIRVLRAELVDRRPLIDQLCVIDSRSTDGTIEIARAEGAQVFFDDEILPEMAPAAGKGEALWKSMFAMDGDIIAWVDSDIENIHPRFAYGLLGPLLDEPDIGYVKAFYERPLKRDGVSQPSGGGRVTELVARPMLNLFYPELSGLIQPLSGEYAGRRGVLESLPFFTGYGVEIGLLLDILSDFGLGALAQVDLDVRVHNNQSIASLSKMSFGIMQAIFKRLADDGKLDLKAAPCTLYNTVGRDEDGYVLESSEISVLERPPIRSIPEYRKARMIAD